MRGVHIDRAKQTDRHRLIDRQTDGQKDRQLHRIHICTFHKFMGTQGLSGRVLDSRPRCREFEPHWCHCFVVLEQDTFILA